MTDTTEIELRRRAERRADAKIGFQVHALVYVLVNLGLGLLNYMRPGHWWFYWPAVGWGIGLLAHGLAVYAPLSGNRERMVQAEMERLRRSG